MPEGSDSGPTSYAPCPHCGDLRPAGSALCPHCGAGTAPGSGIVAVGVTIAKILLAIFIGLLVVPLGATGACMMALGGFGTASPTTLPLALLGVGLLGLAAGGVWLIAVLLRAPGSGGIRR